ncbi:MAG: transferrin-binding protein-like solute binding protein [Moraxella sp.]|nr:transferrin-binding protein-like solute binding protein [Moraxella sp.]
MSDVVHTFRVTPLVLAIGAVFLTACGGGGFSNPSYIESGINPIAIPKPNNTNQNPPNDSEQTSELSAETLAFIRPTLGTVTPIPKRNVGANAQKEQAISINEMTDANAQTLDALKQKLAQQYPDATIYQNTKTNSEYDFVQAGWLFSQLYADGFEVDTNLGTRYNKGNGYVYYYGEKPTMGIGRGEASYLGHWDFTTNAKQIRYKNTDDDQGLGAESVGGGAIYGMDGKFGDHVGATSFAETYFQEYAPREGHHKAEFLVNFDDKKLTGKLSTQKKNTVNEEAHYVDRYNIDATIKGNRFFGSASVPKDKKDDVNTLFNVDATNRLEGGFYGDNAEELAGKFLADDNSMFGVFAAKQTGEIQPLAKNYGTLYVDITHDADFNPRQKSSMGDFTLLGDINQLVINSQVIDLLPKNNDKFSQKSVDLPTGQKAVVTNFGTADGILTLGYLAKTGKSNQKTAAQILAEKQAQQAQTKKALEEKIAAAKAMLESQADIAKQKLMDKIDTLKDELHASLDEYSLADDEQKDGLRESIVVQALAGYHIHNESDKEQVLALLDEIDMGDGLDEEEQFLHNQQIVDQIVAIFDKGEQFDLNNADNWRTLFEIDEETMILATAGELLHRYSIQEILQAKQKLQEQSVVKAQDLDDTLASYEGGEIEIDEMTKAVTKQILAAYHESKHQAVQSTLDDLLEQLQVAMASEEELDDDELIDKDNIIAAITNLLKKGDKFDVNQQDNWRVYLPEIPAVPSKPTNYSAETIRLAQNQLRQKILQEQRELGDMLGEYPELKLLSKEELSADAETQQTLNTFFQQVESKILAYYATSNHAAVKSKVAAWLKDIDAAVAVAEAELVAAGNVAAKRQAALKKLELAVANPQKQLVALIAAGDKADVNQQDNLTTYLDAMTPAEEMSMDNSLNGFYVMGERTPFKEMPNQGQVQYQGTWHGRIHNDRSWSTTPGLAAHDSKAKFDVDFNQKTLTGVLIEKSANEPTFTIDAKITGNTFSGKAVANEKGIYLDKYLDIAGGVIKQNPLLDDNLQGAFYGNNAKHLAGGFSFDGVLERYDGKNGADNGTTIVEPIIGGGVFYGTKDDENE